MRVGVIINPISGRAGTKIGAGAQRESLARIVLGQAGIAHEVILTRARGHAAEIARDFAARSFDRVIAWGGDGTINEAAGPLCGTPVALGIVPSGSGDGLARGLGLAADPTRALHAAIAGHARPIDVGVFAGRHFLNIAGVGFDAAIACAFNERKQRGALGYLSGSLTSVWSYDCGSYELELDHQRFSGPRFLVAFANGRQYGNGIVVAPDADPADGWLNAIVVAGGSAIRQFWRARRLAIARLRPAEGVVRLRVQHARIRGDRLLCHVDGETFETSGEIAVEIRPGSLLVAGLPDRYPA